jgi:HSP20 family molecular chaperone IbpA
MKMTLSIPNEIITSIDVMNTLHGGISEPAVAVKNFHSHRQLTLRVPGIAIDNVHVQIDNHKLVVLNYQTIVSREKEIQFPHVLYNKPIPYFIDADKIAASVNDGYVVVTMPFNVLSGGYHRDIEIQH